MKKVFMNKKTKVITLIIFISIVFALVFSFSFGKSSNFLKGQSYKEPNSVGRFTLTWVAGNNGTTGQIDENGVLQLKPSENNIYNPETNPSGGVHATYQLMFNMGGSEEAKPGTIEIRIPRYIFHDRNGNPLTNQELDIPLVEYPGDTGTGFNYRFVNEDGVDYILLTNYQTIPSSYSFECSISWILINPSTVASGFKNEITGDVRVDLDLDEEIDMHSVSNTIAMEYKTDSKLNSIYTGSQTHFDSYLNAYTNVYSEWQNGWDESLKPENPDDYVYAVWYAYDYVYYATQPYSVTLISEPTDEFGGEVIGYSRCSSSYSSGCFYTSGNNTYFSKEPMSYSITNPSSSSNMSSYYHSLVKYPKSILNDGETHTLENQFTAYLVGVDGAEDAKSKSTSRDYKWVYKDPVTYNYEYKPSYYVSMSKNGYKSYYGTINAFANGENGKVNSSMGSGSNYSDFSFSGTANGAIFTVKDNDTSDPANFGYNTWKANFVDDTVILGTNTSGYEILEHGDYEFTDFTIGSYSLYDYLDYTRTENSGTIIYTGWQTKLNEEYSKYPPVDIYYKTDGDYELLGQIKRNSSSSIKGTVFVDNDGNESPCFYYSTSTGNYYNVKLPEGTTGIKAVVETNKAEVYLRLNVNARLFNTEHVTNLMKDKDSINLYNFTTVYIEDNEEKIYTDFKTSNNGTNLLSAFKTLIEDKDTKEYGQVMRHANPNPSVYTRISGGTTGQNKWVNYSNDSGGRRVKANYTAYAYDYRSYDKEVLSDKDVIDLKIINEQKSGVFYDLLPIGMTVDVDSVKVQTFKPTSGSYMISSPSSHNLASTGIDIQANITLIDNYKGTGRTMMVVRADVPDDVKNYFTYTSGSDNYVYSGMTIRFTGYYSWDNLYDYGNSLTNSIAYKSNSGKLSNGYADDTTKLSISFVDKEYFKDLDGDGNPPGTISDTVYAQRTLSFSFNTASDSSFHKYVKTSNMTDYVDGRNEVVEAMAGGYYSYKLRYASQKNVSTTGLVLYDVIEDYEYNDDTSWRGKITNIDLTQPKSRGIEPVVYYSTKQNLNLYANGKSLIDIDPPSDTDITNIDIWSTTPPSDMSKVTAIAIDMSKDKDGNPYTLVSEESVSVILTMQAPIDNYKSLMEKGAKARNASWWLGTTKQLNEPDHLNFSVYEWTEIGIKEPKISIGKSSKIESGTKDNPSLVKSGDKILYDIAVTNDSIYESITDVIVNESLPDGVIVDYDNISYYYDNDIDNSKLVKDSDAIKAIMGNNAIDFSINQVLSSQVVHLIIPVNVKSGYDEKVLDNTAVIVGYNGEAFVLSSNTTYHKVESIINNPNTGAFVTYIFLIIMGFIVLPILIVNKNKLYKI